MVCYQPWKSHTGVSILVVIVDKIENKGNKIYQ